MNQGHWMKLKKAVETVKTRIDKSPDVAITLGSGLSNSIDIPQGGVTIPCSEIPGFPIPTVAGHSGEFWIGPLCGKTVLIQRGRAHYYEGNSVEDVSFATRMFALLNIPTLIVTNAAGAINPEFSAGDLVLITDHINMLGVNPLRGANIDEFGPRFPDMSAAYTPELRVLAKTVAAAEGIEVKEGVYVAALGPSYETPAEIRSFHIMGADVVGMSTVPEVIVAAHAGIKVLGLSIASNLAAGVDPNATLTHDEVMETTRIKGEEVQRLLLGILEKL